MLASSRPAACARCNATSPFVVFYSWHKTGTVFSEGVAEALLKGMCGYTVQPVWSMADGNQPAHACSAYLATVGVGLVDWTRQEMWMASRALDVQTVLFLREPFEIAASFYTYHLAGEECKSDPQNRQMWKMAYCNRIARDMDARAGMIETARIMMHTQLPDMLRTVRRYHCHANALTIRMEGLRFDFDQTVHALLRFLRIPDAQHSTSIQELVRLDPARSQTLARDAHVSSTSTRLSRFPARFNGSDMSKAHLIGVLTTDRQMCPALANYTYLLGYAGGLEEALATRCGCTTALQ